MPAPRHPTHTFRAGPVDGRLDQHEDRPLRRRGQEHRREARERAKQNVTNLRGEVTTKPRTGEIDNSDANDWLTFTCAAGDTYCTGLMTPFGWGAISSAVAAPASLPPERSGDSAAAC